VTRLKNEMGDKSHFTLCCSSDTFFEEQSNAISSKSFGSQNKRKRLNRAITDYRKFDVQLI